MNELLQQIGVLWAEKKVIDYENGGQIVTHLSMLWKKIFG